MNNGYCVLQWISQNNHTITSIADSVGYSRSMLSQALNHDCISIRLAELLEERYGLQVIATVGLPWQTELRDGPIAQQPVRGRIPGRGEEGASKLDGHMENIKQLLAEGYTQKYIAGLFNTTPSNLHAWMKKRGLKRPRPGSLAGVEKDK